MSCKKPEKLIESKATAAAAKIEAPAEDSLP
jgi:hypothetical protein